MMPSLFTSYAPQETIDFGKSVAQSVAPGSILCFFGEFGVGKTTLIKGIVAGLNGAAEQVCSPTYAYMNLYEARYLIYHFDLYRLDSHEDFLSLGFDEFLFSQGVCCIEWSERIEPLLPRGCMLITMQYTDKNGRLIEWLTKK